MFTIQKKEGRREGSLLKHKQKHSYVMVSTEALAFKHLTAVHIFMCLL